MAAFVTLDSSSLRWIYVFPTFFEAIRSHREKYLCQLRRTPPPSRPPKNHVSLLIVRYTKRKDYTGRFTYYTHPTPWYSRSWEKDRKVCRISRLPPFVRHAFPFRALSMRSNPAEWKTPDSVLHWIRTKSSAEQSQRILYDESRPRWLPGLLPRFLTFPVARWHSKYFFSLKDLYRFYLFRIVPIVLHRSLSITFIYEGVSAFPWHARFLFIKQPLLNRINRIHTNPFYSANGRILPAMWDSFHAGNRMKRATTDRGIFGTEKPSDRFVNIEWVHFLNRESKFSIGSILRQEN